MNSNGIISAPVGIDADISPVLGVGSDDLGYLCSNQHGKINKWSRFKPLVNTVYNGVDLHMWDDFENNNDSSKWWNGGDGQCGLDIPYTESIITSADKYFNGEMAWGYNAPKPNAKQPARALDFDGYNHYAVAPIDNSTMPTDVWLEQAGSDHRFLLELDSVISGTPQENPHNLTLEDIQVPHIYASGNNQYLKNWYLGLLMRSKNKQNIVAVTNTDTIATGSGLNIEFLGNSSWLGGTWDVIPFLSPEPVELFGEEKASKYISIDVPPTTIEVHPIGDLYYGLVNAYFIDKSAKTVGYWGEVINNDSSERTFSATLYIYSTSSDKYDPDTDPEGSQNERELYLGEFTVPGDGGTVNFITTNEGGWAPIITLNSVSDDRFYWAGISINENGVSPKKWIQFEQNQLEA